MKLYSKPEAQIISFISEYKFASLNSWLSQNELTDAGITTYLINS